MLRQNVETRHASRPGGEEEKAPGASRFTVVWRDKNWL
jgi:hypothetical protein